MVNYAQKLREVSVQTQNGALVIKTTTKKENNLVPKASLRCNADNLLATFRTRPTILLLLQERLGKGRCDVECRTFIVALILVIVERNKRFISFFIEHC